MLNLMNFEHQEAPFAELSPILKQLKLWDQTHLILAFVELQPDVAEGHPLRFERDQGPPLAAALQAGVALVKPSLRELRDVMQKPLEHAADWCTAAQSLVHSGAAEIVALSVGEQGAVLATREGVWQAPALNVPATTGTTGAGDCFLAALVWALDRGDAPAEALRWGVAAGAAALLHPGTTLAQAWDLAEQFRQELATEGLLLAGQRLELTTSLGVGCFSSSHDGDADAFFRRVDGALYRAKRFGRDRVEQMPPAASEGACIIPLPLPQRASDAA